MTVDELKTVLMALPLAEKKAFILETLQPLAKDALQDPSFLMQLLPVFLGIVKESGVDLQQLLQFAALFGGEKPLEVLLSPLEKKMEYRVEWPRPIDKDFETARDLYISPEAAASLSEIDDTLDESRSTLVFVNARPLAELLGSRLAMVRTDVGVHHGSLPREERERVETASSCATPRGSS